MPFFHGRRWSAPQRRSRHDQALGLEGRIHLPGQRQDNADLLRAFDLFVLSSRQEGLGSALIEAMAAGCRSSGRTPEASPS